MMNAKVTSILAYITWIGLVIAFVAGDREGAKFHLNQALVLLLAGIVAGVIGIIPVLGWIVSWVASLLIFIFSIMGLVSAVQGTEKPVPLLGGIQLLK